jgi:hypothetical protein
MRASLRVMARQMLFLERRRRAGRVVEISDEIQVSNDNLNHLPDGSTRDLVKNGIEVVGDLPRPYLEDCHLERDRS